MKNTEYWKKRAKIAGRRINESPAYTIPTWPVRKVSNLIGKGIFWGLGKLDKKPPIARFIEYDEDNKKKISGKEKIYTSDDILDGVLDKIAKEKDQNKPKFTAEYFEKNGVLDDIKNLINNQIIDEKDEKSLFGIANKENNGLHTKFVEESNEKIKVHGKGVINYDLITRNERNRIAGQITVFTKKYLEKKPKDIQLIEDEDLNGKDDGPGPLKKYIEDGIKREEISNIKALLIPAILIITGVLALACAAATPIGLGVGIGCLVLGVFAAVSVLVHKYKELSVDKLTSTIQQEEKDRFKNLEQEVADEKSRRQEEKARGKISTGENPGQNPAPYIDPNIVTTQLLQQQLLQQPLNNIHPLAGVQHGEALGPKENQHQQNLINQQQQSGSGALNAP